MRNEYPPKLFDGVVALLRGQLPLPAQIEFDNIVEDARRRNQDIDQLAIVNEIFKNNIVRYAPTPPHLTAVEQASGGRWFELTMGANLT